MVGEASLSDTAAYKTPMLIDTAIPIFSAGLICKVMRIVHGKKAKAISMTPEYTGHIKSPVSITRLYISGMMKTYRR
jgi:hypothetical protein